MNLQHFINRGWKDANVEQPSNDRTVYIITFIDDYGYANLEYGFYDYISGEHSKGKQWWQHPNMYRFTPGQVLLWKDKS